MLAAARRAASASSALLARPTLAPSPLLGACRDISIRRRATLRWKNPRNLPKRRPPEEWDIRYRDEVEIMAGHDAGKIGRVYQRDFDGDWLKVKQLNKAWYLQDPADSGSFEKKWELKEAPLAYTDVLLIDPVDGKGTEVEWRYLESGERVRISKRSGAVVPLPPRRTRNPDADRPPPSVSPFCTTRDDVMEETYVPSFT